MQSESSAEEKETENENSSEEDSEVEDEEEKVANVQDVLAGAYKFFPGKFQKVTDKNIKFGVRSITKNTKLLFNIQINLKDSWLGDPTEVVGENDRCWDPDKLVFKKNFKWVPQNVHLQHPRRMPINFNDEAEESFFKDAPLIGGSSHKVHLNSGIFSPNKVTLDSKFTKIESWGRQGVLECEVTGNIISFCADMMGGISNLLEGLNINDQDSTIMKRVEKNISNVNNFLDLALQTNYRARSFATATCVNAKQELRQSVLDKFNGVANVKEKLLCSDFHTESLFGPIPRDLYNGGASCGIKKPPLTLKTTSQPNAGTKRQGSKMNLPNKRQRFNFDYGNQNYGNQNYGNSFVRPNSQGNNQNWDRFASKALFHGESQRGGKQKRGGKNSRKS